MTEEEDPNRQRQLKIQNSVFNLFNPDGGQSQKDS